MNNVFFGSGSGPVFAEEGICGKYGGELDAETCFKLGFAIASLEDGIGVGILLQSGGEGAIVCDTLSAGLRAGGARLIQLGEGVEEHARFAAGYYKLDQVLFVAPAGEDVRIAIYAKNGLLISRETQRKLESILRDRKATARIPKRFYTAFSPLEGQLADSYERYLQSISSNLQGLNIAIAGDSEQAAILRRVVQAKGAKLPDTFRLVDRFFLIDNELYAITAEGKKVGFWQLFALAALQAGKQKEVFLPQTCPEFIENYLMGEEILVRFYNDSDRTSVDNLFSEDNCRVCLLALSYMAEKAQSLSEATRGLPTYLVVTRDMETPDEIRADAIGFLAEQEESGRGVRIRTEKGSVAVFPRAAGGFKLFAEAVSSEFADELCDLAGKRILGTSID